MGFSELKGKDRLKDEIPEAVLAFELVKFIAFPSPIERNPRPVDLVGFLGKKV